MVCLIFIFIFIFSSVFSSAPFSQLFYRSLLLLVFHCLMSSSLYAVHSCLCLPLIVITLCYFESQCSLRFAFSFASFTSSPVIYSTSLLLPICQIIYFCFLCGFPPVYFILYFVFISLVLGFQLFCVFFNTDSFGLCVLLDFLHRAINNLSSVHLCLPKRFCIWVS